MSAKFWRSQEEEWVSNYYITRVKTGSQSVGDQMSWRSDQLEIRCGRENQHPERLGPQAPAEQSRRTGKKRRCGHKSGGGSICCSSVRCPTHLSHTTLSIKWEVYFSKELCRSSLLCHRYDSVCICICVCIVGHGYATQYDNKYSEIKIMVSSIRINY